MNHKLSPRDFDVLDTVEGFRKTTTIGWGAPFMAGGGDASHHSATMAKLARIGLLERRERGGGPCRVAWEYRCTANGRAFVEQVRAARKKKAAKR